jgi:hypothetical protein
MSKNRGPAGIRQNKAPRLTRQQSLNARPVRNPAVQARKLDNGDAELTIPRREDWLGKLLSWVFYIPKERRVILEGIGAEVWELCDGEHNVTQMIALLVKKYKLSSREAEASLVEYLRSLGKRKLIAFALPRIEGPDKG